MNRNVTGVVQNETIAKIQDNILTEILNPLMGLATAIVFVMFLIGVVRFMIAKANGDSAQFESGKKHLLYGILGLFIISSIWGILILIANLTGSNIWFVK